MTALRPTSPELAPADRRDRFGTVQPKRVMVAEDDPEMRRLVADALRKDGYEVVEVPNGGRMLVQVTDECFRASMPTIDLIVSDVRMPVCSGLEIVRAIRDSGWMVPVILMTAFGDDETRDRAAAMNALLFDKPFQLDDLRTAVLSLVRSSS
jgi:DNA-binding response OmpR family regulator